MSYVHSFILKLHLIFLNNKNLVSYSSGGQKSEMGFTGLNQEVRLFLLEAIEENPFPFPGFRDCQFSFNLGSLSSIFQISNDRLRFHNKSLSV